MEEQEFSDTWKRDTWKRDICVLVGFCWYSISTNVAQSFTIVFDFFGHDIQSLVLEEDEDDDDDDVLVRTCWWKKKEPWVWVHPPSGDSGWQQSQKWRIVSWYYLLSNAVVGGCLYSLYKTQKLWVVTQRTTFR
jgi:hypothetical protein